MLTGQGSALSENGDSRGMWLVDQGPCFFLLLPGNHKFMGEW